MGYEIDDLGVRLIGYGVPISFYDPTRTLRAQIYLQSDGTLNLGGIYGSASPSTGGLGIHALGNTIIHTGVIADSQAPQFLKTDGSRTLLGNLAVAAGVTIDGVDVSAHGARHAAAGGDAVDHDALTNFVADEHVAHSGVTLTAGEGITGGGTIAASRSFDLMWGTPTISTIQPDDSASAGASTNPARSDHKHAIVAAIAGAIQPDDAAAEGTATSFARSDHKHAIVAAAASTLTVASVNAEGDATSFARSNHTHTITTSNNPGAAAAILASTSAGGLTLQSLAVQGAVDITNGDLTVLDGATTVFFVNESANNVGIMTNMPDPQFALDVNGPLRAQYLIGPHAIQLSDALMICHFDGSYPFATNFDVDTTGHLGQVSTAENIIGRPGKFGKAIEVGEATTNHISDPAFGNATLTTGWTNSGMATFERSQGQVYIDEYSCHCESDTTADHIYSNTVAEADGGETWTAQARIYVESGEVSLVIEENNSGWSDAASATTTMTGEWELITVTVTLTAGVTDARVKLTPDTTAATEFYVDAVQLEHKPYPTPFTYGSMPNSAWASGEHASASSRNAAKVYWDGVLQAYAGSWSIWWSPAASSTVQPLGYIVSTHGLSAYYSPTDNKMYLTDGVNVASSSALTFSAEDWLHLVFTWDPTTGMAIYIDGVLDGSNATYVPYGSTNPFLDGDFLWQPNGRFDDLVILDRAVDAEEVRAIYESDAPVFSETSIQVWRSPAQVPIWVDEEGLWGRDENGNASIGWASSAKSWGGQSLGAGDLLLGHGTEYLLWDASEASLTVTGSIIITGGSGIASLADAGSLATADEVDWSTQVTGAAKPEDNATVGADWGSNLSNIPSMLGTPSGAGLYLASTHMGYYDSAAWKVYIDSGGNLVLGDPAGTAGLAWNQTTGTLNIKGSITLTNTITAANIAAGTITADHIAAGTITGAKIAATTITAANIAAGTITATQIATGTITADRLNVSTLSAITANLGTVTAGEIRVGTGTVGTNFTGFRIYSSYIGGFNNDVLQAGIRTSDGKIIAGGGNVLLDVEGIKLGMTSSGYLRWYDGATQKARISYYSSVGNEFWEFYSVAGSPATILIGATAAYAFSSSEFSTNRRIRTTQGMLADESIYINDSANAKQTLGLTINQGSADDEILALKSSDVAHGMTDWAETDTYGAFSKLEDTSGGLLIRGFKDAVGTNAHALYLQGLLGEAATTTKSTSANGVVTIGAAVKSGTSVTAVGANGNLVVIHNNGVARFIFDAEGDAHADVQWTTFDAYDDVALLTDLERAMLAQRDPVKAEFVNFLQYNHDALEDAGIVHFDRDNPGHAMVNTTKLSMALVGAIRQMNSRMDALEARMLTD